MFFAHFDIQVVNYDKYMQSIKMHCYYTEYKMDLAIKSKQPQNTPENISESKGQFSRWSFQLQSVLPDKKLNERLKPRQHTGTSICKQNGKTRVGKS